MEGGWIKPAGQMCSGASGGSGVGIQAGGRKESEQPVACEFSMWIENQIQLLQSYQVRGVQHCGRYPGAFPFLRQSPCVSHQSNADESASVKASAKLVFP